MNNKFEVGKSVEIKKGTELNHGLHEDSDFIVLLEPVRAVVVSLDSLKDGGIEILVPGHEDWSPLFWHQPEVLKPSGS